MLLVMAAAAVVVVASGDGSEPSHLSLSLSPNEDTTQVGGPSTFVRVRGVVVVTRCSA